VASENAVMSGPGLARCLAGDMAQVDLPCDAGWEGLAERVRDPKQLRSLVSVGGAVTLSRYHEGIPTSLGAGSASVQAGKVVRAEQSTGVAVATTDVCGPLFRTLKRAGDVVVSGGLLCLLLVPMVLVACAVRLTSRGPVLFRATRIGRNGVPFTCLKFRTMLTHAPVQPQLPDHHAYLTPIGGFLRRCSIDELPQLVNIIRGEMSLIGPRPVPADEVFTVRGREMNGAVALRPGLTGLAQVSGRDMNSEEQRLFYDGEYVKRISFGLDMLIVAKTVRWVFRGDVSRPKPDCSPQADVTQTIAWPDAGRDGHRLALGEEAS